LVWSFKALHYLLVWLGNSCVLRDQTIKNAEEFIWTNIKRVHMFVNGVSNYKLPPISARLTCNIQLCLLPHGTMGWKLERLS
jgi:hypothetical protein